MTSMKKCCRNSFRGLKQASIIFCLVITQSLSLTAIAASEPSVAERQSEILDMRSKVLSQLFGDIDDAREILERCWGYAIFSNTGVNLLMFSTARGTGVLRDHRDGSDTFMKVFGAGAGMGAGTKNYTAVLVFQTEAALEDFRNKGWELSGQAEANLNYDNISTDKGGEVVGTAGAGVLVYQLTDSGFALQALVQGFKYWVDPKLNE